MQVNFCEECGEKLTPGAKFCENCGYKIDQEVCNVEKKQQPEPIQKREQEMAEKAENQISQSKNNSKVKNVTSSKKKSNVFAIVSVIAVMIVLCFAVWVLIPYGNEKASDNDDSKSSISDQKNNNNIGSGLVGNTGGNSANLGFAIGVGDKVIFCNNLGIESGGDTVITNMDGKATEQFLGESCMTMDFDGEWVYYSHYLFDRGIFRIKPDKSEKSKIADDEVAYLRAAGDWLYYSDSDFYLHRMKKDGSSNTIISDTPGEFINIVENKIYYIEGFGEDGTIHQMSTDGTQKKQLLTDKATKLIYHEGWLYYINITDGNKVYRVSTDGTGKEKLLDEFCNSINIDNNWIYYTPYSSNGLYKINFNGTGKQSFTENEECYVLNIVGENLYYVVFENNEDKVYIVPK